MTIIVKALFATLMFALGSLLAVTLMPTPSTVQAADTTAPSAQEVKVQNLFAQHDCWTGEAPTSAWPSHAILTFTNGNTRYVGPLGVEAALQHIFEGVENNIATVHAFCR
jgi:hypothetical protein